MHRLFVAIRPPEEVRDALIDAMEDSPALRWVADDNLHCTLRFIGEIERPLANDIADALGRIRFDPFEVRLSEINRFDRRGGGAVWAGVEPRDPLAALALKVDRACQSVGLPPEHRAFHPHITLARYSRASRADAERFTARKRTLGSPSFLVDRFTLFESRLSRHGPHYHAVEDYPRM